MIRFILVLLLVLIAVWIGIEVKNTDSYVSVFYQDYTVSMKLITAIIILVVCFIVLHLIINLLNAIFSFPKRCSVYRREHKLNKAYTSLLNAITELLQGHPKISEKLLLKASSYKKNGAVCYLLAAKAAHYLNARERINDYCKMAYTADPQLELAINLTQAKLFFENEQYELVLANLNHIKTIDPQNIAILKLYFKTYKKLNDWLKVLALIPDLNRENLYPDEFIKQLERECYINHLLELKKQKSIEVLYNFFEQMPKKYKLDNQSMLILINSYLDLKQINIDIQNNLESYAKQSLNHNWSDDLLITYSNLPSENYDKKLRIIASWQKDQPYNINLLVCLAKTHIKLKQYENAKDCLIKAEKISPNYENINLLLGYVYNELKDSQSAISYFTKHYEVNQNN